MTASLGCSPQEDRHAFGPCVSVPHDLVHPIHRSDVSGALLTAPFPGAGAGICADVNGRCPFPVDRNSHLIPGITTASQAGSSFDRL
jgi:hypothetical protein